MQALSPDTLLVPESCRIPVGSKVWHQLISTTINDILQFLFCLGIAVIGNLRAAESLPHIGISQVSLSHTLGTTTILVIEWFPIKKFGSLREILNDEVPHLLVSFSSCLHWSITEVLTSLKHRHTTKGGSQPSIEITTESTSLTFTLLFGIIANLIGFLKTSQIEVGTSNGSISMSPSFAQLANFIIPSLVEEFHIPTSTLGIHSRVRACKQVWLEAPVVIFSTTLIISIDTIQT